MKILLLNTLYNISFLAEFSLFLQNEDETFLSGGHCGTRELHQPTNHHVLAVASSVTSTRSTPPPTSGTPTALLTTDTSALMQNDCSICGKIFSSKALLTRHMKGQHQLLINPATPGVHGGSMAGSTTVGAASTSEWKCDHCKGRFFPTQLTLIKHLKTQHQITIHEVESSSPILASSAGGACNNSASMTSEANSGNKRQPGEKRFQCGQCSKRFPTSKDLKRHDVVHTGNREFQCSFCSHRFGRKDHRMRHEKKTHANELLSAGSSPISPKTEVNQTVFVKRGAAHADLHQDQHPLSHVGGGSALSSSMTSERRRWRHVSSPSIASSDFDMDSPIRLRAMSTSEPPTSIYGTSLPSNANSSNTCPQAGPHQQNLFTSDLKYLESQLSPESLQETGSSAASNMSPDLNSVKEEIENEDTCGSEDTCKSDLDWIMSDFMVKTEDSGKVVESVLSPSPDSSSLSPPGFYTDSPTPGPPQGMIKTEIIENGDVGPSAPQPPTPSTPTPVMPALQPLPQCPKQLMSDFLTRTKNPVLPSVYIDNSLIVPEPSKQKYHNPHPLLSPEDMDDYYEAFMDDKDLTETLFHV